VNSVRNGFRSVRRTRAETTVGKRDDTRLDAHCATRLGTCVPLSGVDGQCLCHVGYSGRLCELAQQTFCSLSPCRNGSTCIVLNHTGDGFCLCPSEFAGPFCEYISPSVCRKRCPTNRGKCALIDNKYGRCLCPKDVTGVFCDVPLHPCAPNPCGSLFDVRPESPFTGRDGTGRAQRLRFLFAENNGICVHETTSQSYKCLCTFGYSGSNCSENLNQSFCSSSPCANNGTCLESPTSADGICQCEQGFGGRFCDELVECADQHCHYPEQVCLADSCVNVTGELYCLLHECQHGGKCDEHTRQCRCPQGFAGRQCELNSLFCLPHTEVCRNNGTCLSSEGRCACSAGFTGRLCDVSMLD
jgi:Notch 1